MGVIAVIPRSSISRVIKGVKAANKGHDGLTAKGVVWGWTLSGSNRGGMSEAEKSCCSVLFGQTGRERRVCCHLGITVSARMR